MKVLAGNYHNFSKQLGNLGWIEQKVFDFPINTFKVKSAQKKFFLAKNTYYIVGSDRIYWDLINIPNFSLSNNALIFVEEGLMDLKDNNLTEIVLYNKSDLDLSASLLDKKFLISPSDVLGLDPNETGFWKREASDLISWRVFLQEKYGLDNLDFDYGSGWSVAENNLELKVHSEKFKRGNILLARVMKSTRGGAIEFLQNDRKIGEVSTLEERPKTVELKLTGYNESQNQIFVGALFL